MRSCRSRSTPTGRSLTRRAYAARCAVAQAQQVAEQADPPGEHGVPLPTVHQAAVMDLTGAGDEMAARWRNDPQEATAWLRELVAGGELAADEVLDQAVDSAVLIRFGPSGGRRCARVGQGARYGRELLPAPGALVLVCWGCRYGRRGCGAGGRVLSGCAVAGEDEEADERDEDFGGDVDRFPDGGPAVLNAQDGAAPYRGQCGAVRAVRTGRHQKVHTTQVMTAKRTPAAIKGRRPQRLRPVGKP